MVPTVSFDFLEAFFEWDSQQILSFNFEEHDKIKERIFNQLVDIGYDSLNNIMLLQTLAVVLFIYIIQISLLGLFTLFITLTKNKYGGKNLANKINEQLFFNPIIELFLQGYFEFLISALLTFKLDSYELLGEKISQIMSFASVIVTLGLLPLALTIIIFIDSKKLSDEKF